MPLPQVVWSPSPSECRALRFSPKASPKHASLDESAEEAAKRRARAALEAAMDDPGDTAAEESAKQKARAALEAAMLVDVAHYLPKVMQRVTVLKLVSEGVYKADNALLRENTLRHQSVRAANLPGVLYRKTKDMDDTAPNTLLSWGSTVRGTDCGDGWIEVIIKQGAVDEGPQLSQSVDSQMSGMSPPPPRVWPGGSLASSPPASGNSGQQAAPSNVQVPSSPFGGEVAPSPGDESVSLNSLGLEEFEEAEPLPEPRAGANISVGQVAASLAQCTTMALHCRRTGDTAKAIKQLERGVVLCKAHERQHPAIAVEAARARLNLGAALSRGGRHRAAKAMISEAMGGLEAIIDWVDGRGEGEQKPQDPGVETLGEEAKKLHCAALLAIAIESESAAEVSAAAMDLSFMSEISGEDGDGYGLQSTPKASAAQLYADARSLAEVRLPQTHPLACLSGRLNAGRAVRATSATLCSHEVKVHAMSAPTASTASRPRPGPVTGGVAQGSGGGSASRPSVNTGAADTGLPPTPVGAAAAGKSAAQSPQPRARSPATRVNTPAKAASSTLGFTSGTKLGLGQSQTFGKSDGGFADESMRGERAPRVHDLFAEFIYESGAGQRARYNQEEMQKQFTTKVRDVALQIMLAGDDDLHHIGYTKGMHDSFTKRMEKMNTSRSDPSLVKEATYLSRRGKVVSPEAVNLRRMNKSFSSHIERHGGVGTGPPPKQKPEKTR